MKWFQKGLAKISIMDTTKQYMASDSIMANPTNNVLVMVCAASGCWAIELNAVATERPWLKAGIMAPTPMVSPAVMIDTTAIKVELSIMLIVLIYAN